MSPVRSLSTRDLIVGTAARPSNMTPTMIHGQLEAAMKRSNTVTALLCAPRGDC